MTTRKSMMIFIGILLIGGSLLGSVTQAAAETKKYRSAAQFSRWRHAIGDIEDTLSPCSSSEVWYL